MRVAIVGSRNCGDLKVEDMIPYIPLNCSSIITGGAKGVDALAVKAALELNIDIEEILPEYDKYGKAAPLKRNEKIADRCYLLLAFWDMKSRGTAQILAYCINNRIPFKIIRLK